MSKKCSKNKECNDRPFYYDCECPTSNVINVLQAIRDAMKDEREASRMYHYMAKKAPCEADKQLFYSIRRDEKRHYCLLQEIYRDLTCECYCVDEISVRKPKGYCRALKKAICHEMQDATDYENLASALTCVEHQEIVICIMNDEKEHAQKLAALYKLYQDCACRCQEKALSASACTGYVCGSRNGEMPIINCNNKS